MIVVLAISVMGAQLPSSDPLGRLEPAALLIALCWLACVWLINRAMDSLTVLVLYAAGIAGLIAVTNH